MYQNGLLKQIPGLGYDNNYSYNRYNYRANLDFKLTETTDMKFNISGVIGNTQEPLSSANNIWMRSMLWAHPTGSPGVVDGFTISNEKNGANAAIPKSLTAWNGWEYYWWDGYQKKIKTTLGIDMTLTQRLDFITDGLGASIKGSYDTSLAITKQWKGSGGYHQTLYYASWVNNPTMRISDPAFDKTYQHVISGSEPMISYNGDEPTDDDKSWYLEARVDYSRKFDGKHAVSGLLLYNQSRDYYPSKYKWLPRGYVGWVGRATYGYADKYLVDLSAGYNGSENFAPGKTRYGFFPSISLGWVISEEQFMKSVNWVDFLKLRGSTGLVGNDQGTSARFMYMEGVWNEAGVYYFGSGKSDGVPRYSLGTPGNQGVTWETALKTNVGVDFDLLNYRLHFSGDLFWEQRTGILIAPKTLPSIIATDTQNMNLGKVNNRGYEVELGWKDHIGNFTYDLNANVTFARNTIIFEDEIPFDEPYMAETGGSTGRKLLYQFVRLYQKSDFYTDENGVQRLNPDLPQPTETVHPGDAMYEDVNGDGKVNGNDRVRSGYPDRPEYVFGSNWKFGYKGFNLQLNWVAATNVNREWYWDYRCPFTNTGHRGLLTIHAENAWIDNDNPWGVPGREDGTLPRFTQSKWNSGNDYLSTLWVTDASYIRLKSMSFGYTFSRNRYFDRLGIGSLGLMFTGYNMLTFTKMTLQDPEANSDAWEGNYPLVKTYNLALNITF